MNNRFQFASQSPAVDPMHLQQAFRHGLVCFCDVTECANGPQFPVMAHSVGEPLQREQSFREGCVNTFDCFEVFEGFPLPLAPDKGM